jgi:hypothetical protein
VVRLAVGDAPGSGAEAAWEACGGLGVRRTPGFLSWRYTARPHRYYRFYAPAHAPEEGLAVAAFHGDQAALAELWLPPGSGGEPFLRAVAGDLRAAGIGRWRAWPAPGDAPLLRELGMRPAGEWVPRGCRGAVGGPGSETVARAASLYHPPGDYDLV